MNNPGLLAGMLSLCLLGASPWAAADNPTVYTLEDIFQQAESNSATLRPAFSTVKEAREQERVARNGLLPEIEASLSLSYIGDGFTTKRNFSDYQKATIPHLGTGLSLNISQPVYTGGAVTAAIDMAGLQTTAARFAADFSRDNLRFALAGFYLDIYKYSNLRKVVENNIAHAEKMLAEMEARYEQGTALRNDITRYELLLEDYKLRLVKINNTLDILNNNLVVTAGLPAGTTVEPDSTILARALPSESEQWWQQEADEHSPAISLARLGVAISRKAETLAKADRLPKVGIQAGWTMDGPILVEVPPINRNLSYWFVGVGVSYNLSSLYKTNKSIAKSKVATVKALDDLDLRREEVSLAVRAAYIKYLEAYEELKTRDKSVELALRNYNTTATRYSADMALITDMLDAANSRIDAEQQLVNARIDILYYYYKLLFTSGKI